MAINDWVTSEEGTKTITAVFRPRRGLDERLLEAIDAAEKRNPCLGYQIIEVPNSWVETTKRRYMNPDDLLKQANLTPKEKTGTTRYELTDRFEYFIRIPLTEDGSTVNLVEALKREDPDNPRSGLKFAQKLIDNPELLKQDGAIKVERSGEHFLTIMRYVNRPDVLEITLAKPTTTEITFQGRIAKVNQYVNRIFRSLDKKKLVRYE